jgi:predicted RNA binding protein YcfA (HicA-like mRNA interferase family)
MSDAHFDVDNIVRIHKELLAISSILEENVPPFMIRLFFDSFTVCSGILLDSLNNFHAMQTEEVDRAFQIGNTVWSNGRAREPLDPKDKLSEFKIEHFVEPYFHLTDPESALIQELFDTTPLDSNMTMFDILGFALYERLENLKGIGPQFNEILTNIQGLLSTYCLSFYVGLQRSSPDKIQALGAVNAWTKRVAILPDNFIEKIDEAFSALQSAIKTTRVEARKPTGRQIETLKANQARVLDQITKTVIPLRNLYEKLLQCKGRYHLLLRAVSSYQGYEALNHPNKAGRASVKRYFDYVKSGYQTGAKEKLLGITYNFDAVMKKEFPFSDRPLEKEMVAFGTKMVAELAATYQSYQLRAIELREALNHGLDHKAWLARTGQKGVSEKNLEEFREQLFSNCALTEMLRAFLSDTLRLVEHRIYPSGTLTTESCAFRLVHNLHKHMQKKNGGQTPAPSLPPTMSSKVKAILGRIDEVLTDHEEIIEYSLRNENVLIGSFNHTEWLELLLPIESKVTALYAESLKALIMLKVELIQGLKTQWSALSLEELQKIDVPGTKEAIFQEGLRLMRPLWVLSDMLVLLQKRHYSEVAAIIPRELADVMDLDGLPEMLQTLIQDKTPMPSKEEEKPSIPPLPVQKPKEAIVERPKKAVKFKQQQEKKPEPKKTVQVTTAPAPLPEVQELAYLTKSREILKRLSEIGFYEVRTRGSHHILNGPNGGMVVVPENADLPRGTRKGIVDQASKALNKKSSSL